LNLVQPFQGRNALEWLQSGPNFSADRFLVVVLSMHSRPTEREKQIRDSLLEWYGLEKRDLPWRDNPSPYMIWISEVMLQQTRVAVVIPYYRRFIEKFKDVNELANASLDDVLKVWENLGYYGRARNLHKAAKIAVQAYNGNIPRHKDTLMSLPGIGAYMAGAILSMAFNERIPAVDGNVRRVISRLFALDDPLDKREGQKRVEALAAALVPDDRPGEFNQAMMDLGARICFPKNPLCPECPVALSCRARIMGREHELPVIGKKKSVPVREADAVVIKDSQGRYLMRQRSAEGFLGGLWSWPQYDTDTADESKERLLKEIETDLGLKVQSEGRLGIVKHQYSHFKLVLNVYTFHLLSTRKSKRNKGCWVDEKELTGLALSKADRRVWELVVR
jgi:A/G-specific adenine glycosylase